MIDLNSLSRKYRKRLAMFELENLFLIFFSFYFFIFFFFTKWPTFPSGLSCLSVVNSFKTRGGLSGDSLDTNSLQRPHLFLIFLFFPPSLSMSFYLTDFLFPFLLKLTSVSVPGIILLPRYKVSLLWNYFLVLYCWCIFFDLFVLLYLHLTL